MMSAGGLCEPINEGEVHPNGWNGFPIHEFDGSTSGSGEICFARFGERKCIQKAGHYVHTGVKRS